MERITISPGAAVFPRLALPQWMCSGRRKFSGDRDRLAFLFDLYQRLVTPLATR